jgi:NAD(P)-dependent dehydrogenase (short-subunit alcohol dehydrogenase family)
MSHDGSRAVVVTGASTGIGRACALMLDRRGFRVFAGVRREDDAKALAAAASERLTPLYLDVTDAAAIAAARNLVAGEVHGLVNNAGTMTPCPMEYLPVAEFRRQLEVNLIGHLALTQAFLPRLRRPGGRIVNVSSPAGRLPVPLMASYTAAKHGLVGLSGVMRSELGPAGIHVAVIEPGLIATAMGDKMRHDIETTLDALPDHAVTRYGGALRALAATASRVAAQGAHPDVVAQSILHALTAAKPRAHYPAGPGTRRLLILARLLPERALDRLIAHRLDLPVRPVSD